MYRITIHIVSPEAGQRIVPISSEDIEQVVTRHCGALLCAPESGDRLRMGRDAALGHGRGGHGLLLRVRSRGEEAALGQDLHTIRE